MSEIQMYMTLTLSANETVIWSKREKVDSSLNRMIESSDQQMAILSAEEALIVKKANKPSPKPTVEKDLDEKI